MKAPDSYESIAAQLDDELYAQGAIEPGLLADTPDTHRVPPKPDIDCLYGLVGEVARAGSERTEANPFAVAASFMTYLCTAMGRGPFLDIGDDRHNPRVYTLHVGRSSRGRKGTAIKLTERVAEAVKRLDPDLAPQIHRGGLSTREGLALMIHDGFAQGKDEIPAIEDKRIWVIESEFANVLHQAKRDGNTLSAALRDCWDGSSIKPATKTSRVWASNPHVNLTGNITPSELKELMRSRELSNGFANRFLIFWAEQHQVLPFPEPTSRDVVERLAQKVAEALRFAGSAEHDDRDVLQLSLSSEAKALYRDLYLNELRDRSGGELVSTLLERRAPMLLRLAMLFALTDQTQRIDVAHIRAAYAWIRYWTDSVKYIFQNFEEEQSTAKVAGMAGQILSYLSQHDQATRAELVTACFGGHAKKAQIDKAIDELLLATPPVVTLREVPRPNGQAGSGTKVYELAAKSAKSAKSQEEPALPDAESTMNAAQGEESPGVDLPFDAPDLATLRRLREQEHLKQLAEENDISQSSHISQDCSDDEDARDVDEAEF